MHPDVLRRGAGRVIALLLLLGPLRVADKLLRWHEIILHVGVRLPYAWPSAVLGGMLSVQAVLLAGWWIGGRRRAWALAPAVAATIAALGWYAARRVSPAPVWLMDFRWLVAWQFLAAWAFTAAAAGWYAVRRIRRCNLSGGRPVSPQVRHLLET